MTLPAALVFLLGLGAVGLSTALEPVDRARAPEPICQVVPGNLPFYYDLYTFRGSRGRTAIVAAYAAEAGRLHKESDEGCTQYRMVVSLVLADVSVGLVSRTDDSVTVRMERAPSSDHLIRTHLEVHAAPSASTFQRVIVSDVTTPGFGQLYDGPFPIPDYNGSELMLSDIAFGEVRVPGGWTRGNVTLALLPTGRLPEGSFDLYYEVYNLPASTPYSTQITIQRLNEAGTPIERDEVSARFLGVAAANADGDVAELRRIDSPLRPGSYRLTVTVRNELNGQNVQHSRRFQVDG